jgi:hypothetical protein
LKTTLPTPLARADTAGAQVMASAWTGCVVALWRGDPLASAFAEWLASFWEPSLQRPEGEPDAQSPFAAGGLGIDWFERDGWVSGHIPGQEGGYLLPRLAIFGQPWAATLEPAA